jgi:hypothetical protein
MYILGKEKWQQKYPLYTFCRSMCLHVRPNGYMQENTTAMPARHNDIIPQRMQTCSPGLHVYEDTRLMQENGPAAAQPSQGFQLYEDTQFISTPAAASALAARIQPLALQVGSRLECTLT